MILFLACCSWCNVCLHGLSQLATDAGDNDCAAAAVVDWLVWWLLTFSRRSQIGVQLIRVTDRSMASVCISFAVEGMP